MLRKFVLLALVLATTVTAAQAKPNRHRPRIMQLMKDVCISCESCNSVGCTNCHFIKCPGTVFDQPIQD